MTGELYIGGEGVTRGYLNQPALTEKSFPLDPFSSHPESRLYRTGDLVRLLPDGNLEFLGRLDQQIKIRGLRVELEEIEAVFGQHPGVREAAVIVRLEESGRPSLVAFLAAHPGRQSLYRRIAGFPKNAPSCLHGAGVTSVPGNLAANFERQN